MKLSFCTLNGTICVEMPPEHFKRLRDPLITPQEVCDIANFCGIEKSLLLNYVKDILITSKEMHEIDGSCDYSDYL